MSGAGAGEEKFNKAILLLKNIYLIKTTNGVALEKRKLRIFGQASY